MQPMFGNYCGPLDDDQLEGIQVGASTASKLAIGAGTKLALGAGRARSFVARDRVGGSMTPSATPASTCSANGVCT